MLIYFCSGFYSFLLQIWVRLIPFLVPWCIILYYLFETFFFLQLCETVPEDTWTNVYLSQIGNQWWTKVRISPESILVHSELYWDYLQEYRWELTYRNLQDYSQEYGWEVTYRSWNDYITKAPPTPSQYGWQFMKNGNLEHTAQPVGSSTGGRISFQ